MVSSDIADSFLPILSDRSQYPPKVMILGSSPGKASLQQQQYYAHPRNSFWWIMSQVLSFESAVEYECRLELLRQSGILLWDVLRQCERKGSLDVNIKRQSEKANDIELVLKKHDTISVIFFNGKASYSIFKRHFLASSFKQVECIVLPSTSPAHASMSWKEKLESWRVIKQYLDA